LPAGELFGSDSVQLARFILRQKPAGDSSDNFCFASYDPPARIPGGKSILRQPLAEW
jgi:hypothetical protein